MINDFFSVIRSGYPTYTKIECTIADYVLENPEKTIYMSIVDLAEACNIGDTSVFRFCKKLNLRGYQEFKLRLAQSLALDEDNTLQMLGEVTLDDPVDIVFSKYLSATTKVLQETSQLLHPGKVDQAVECMIRANKVLFLGAGASMLTALEAKNKFMRITNKVDFMLDFHMQAMQASLLTPNDAAIIFSYSGNTKDTIELAQIGKKTGAKIISITRFSKSLLAASSDIVLLCSGNESPFQGGSISAKISQLYILDILFTVYFMRTAEQSKENTEKTAKAVIDTHI